MTKRSSMTNRSVLCALACGAFVALAGACTPPPSDGSVTPAPVDMTPVTPPAKMDAKKPDPEPEKPTPGTSDAGVDKPVSEPPPSSPPDAAGEVAAEDAEPPVDDMPDALPPGDGGASTIVVGQRTSLRSDLAARWVGTRKSVTVEEGAMVFTGIFEAGKFGGPQGHNIRLPIKPGIEYVFEYRIRFDTNFHFSRGGKIPGLAGGNAPTGCVNVDANGFSARMMWRENGKLIGYLYDQDQSQACGAGIATPFNFKVGQFHDIKERVKLNSGSTNNGILQVWVDGNMLIDRSNIEYMAEKPANRISSILFHSFFGGSTGDWAPSRNCSISFSEPFVTLVAE